MRTRLLALTTLLALLAGAPSALASGRDVIVDCTDDEILSKVYTQKEYKEAIASFPADADQYGVCRDIIARAQEAAATKGGSKKGASNGSDGASAAGAQGPTDPPVSTASAKDQLAAAAPADRAAAEQAVQDGSPAVVGAGDAVDVASVGRAPDAGQVSDLPAPVLVLLALLLAGALALAAVRIRSLVNARRA